MRDIKDVMTQFVKIVERYPVIYDRRLDSHKSRHLELAWEKVAENVRNEIQEECSVEELKVKWKGVRSSYGRYRNKCLQGNNSRSSCKKYYLYDSLKYLEPFAISKGKQTPDQSDSIYEDTCAFVDVDDTDNSSEDNTIEDWSTDIKPKVRNKGDTCFTVDVEEMCYSDGHKDFGSDTAKKRKLSDADMVIDDDDNENLNFFKSILPDVRGFNIKEKRKLKMGILKLIDDIENERQQQ